MSKICQAWLISLMFLMCACEQKPPTSPPSRDDFEVQFPRNRLVCNQTSKAQAQRWVQHMPMVKFEQSLGRKGLVTVSGERVSNVPKHVFTLTKETLFLDDKKLLDVSNLNFNFKQDLLKAMKVQGVDTQNNYTLAVTKDAPVLAFWQFVSLLPKHVKITISFLHISPKAASFVEPLPSFVHERFKASLGVLPEGTPANAAKRVEIQQKHLTGLLRKAASQCKKSPKRFASLVSPQGLLEGAALVDSWFTCECAFDLEMLLVAVYGEQFKGRAHGLTILPTPIHAKGTHRVSFDSIKEQTWSQFAPTLSINKGICLDKVPEAWCKNGGQFLCQSACPKVSEGILNKIDTGTQKTE